MQANPTDAEIRANVAFPRVLRAARINSRVFWGGLPFFVATAIYWILQHHMWTIVVGVLLAVGNVAGQLYGFRQSRRSLSDISEIQQVRGRAWKLATVDAKPRLVGWLPGA